MLLKTVIIAFVALSLTGCTSTKQEPDKVDSAKITIPDSAGGMKTLNADNTLKSLQTVLLKKIEEGAYPMASLNVQLSAGTEITLDLNLEDYKGVRLAELKKNTGHSIQVLYTTRNENSATQIILNNKNLFDGKPFKQSSGELKAAGVLNAPAVSIGDLPDSFTVKKEDGNILSFPFFITPEMVKANGKKVDVYYMQREVSTVKEIELLKK